MYSIYQFENKNTGEKYIGYAGNERSRFSSHCQANTLLGNAIKTQGIENFDYIILHETDSLIEAKDIERYYIRFFNSVKYGYNLIYSSSGPSEEGKVRISAARKNTMVVKDKLTQKIIGSINTNHPKVISGEWVHHTHGLTHVIDPKTQKRKWVSKAAANNYKKWEADIKGTKNGKYSGYTRLDIIKTFLAYSTFIEVISDDKNIFSSRHFTKTMKLQNPLFPTFPGSLKEFRFPELRTSSKRDMAFMIDNFLPKEFQKAFVNYYKGKTREQCAKVSQTITQNHKKRKFNVNKN